MPQLAATRAIEGRVISDDEVLARIVISAHDQLGPVALYGAI